MAGPFAAPSNNRTMIDRRFHRIMPMQRALQRLTFLILLLSCPSTLFAQLFPGLSLAAERPPRTYDLIHTALDVRLDHERKIVSGSVTHTLRLLDQTVERIQFDADSAIVIESVVIDGESAAFQRDSQSVRCELSGDILPVDHTITVQISYHVTPRKGIYFVHAEENEPEGRDQIWTQGEGEDHRFWIPTYDYPDDLATSEIRATVRGDWQLLSNGARKSVVDNSDGTKTWHYAMEKPHATYLLMIAAGDFLITRDTVLGIPLTYWTYPDAPDKVPVTFAVTPDVLTYFDSLLGYPYPWGSYAQVVVDEFMFGGMENTTATVLNDDLLVDAREKLDYDPTDVIAHEIAHQWFGDLVTCKTWDHLWLNESFATYLAARYLGSRYGEEIFLKKLYDWRNGARHRDTATGRHPIVSPTPYIDLVYGRGAFVLHMLNQEVGEKAFWKAVRLYLNRHKHSNVETKDLQAAFEEVTGNSLGWFFDQWVYGAGMPIIQISVDAVPNTSSRSTSLQKSSKITLKQIQEHDSLTGDFRFRPWVYVWNYYVPFEQWYHHESVNEEWKEHDGDYEAFIPFHGGPFNGWSDSTTIVPFPGATLLATIIDSASVDDLLRSLGVPSYTVDRLESVVRLISIFENDSIVTTVEQESEVTDVLLSHYPKETVPFIRAELIRLAATLGDPRVESIISNALTDPHHNVRLAAVNASWRLDTDTLVTRLTPLLYDSSFSVVTATLAMLEDKSKMDLRPRLRELQLVPGHRESVAQTWVTVVGDREYEEFYDRVVWYARYGDRNRTRSNGLRAIAKFDDTDVAVRQAIAAGLRDESEEIFKAAITAYKEHDDDELEEMAREILRELDEERATMLSKAIDD